MSNILGRIESGIYTVGFELNGGSLGATKTFKCKLFQTTYLIISITVLSCVFNLTVT